MKSGILLINKEEGMTSFDVIRKLRPILKIRKMGHFGTLDPNATGLLPIAIEDATKVISKFEYSYKEYYATLKLGLTTDTYDIWGKVKSQGDYEKDIDKIKDTILSFVGKSTQVVPPYSAKKVNGKKLYEYAREGIEIELPTTNINILELDILDINPPEVSFRVYCSKGTYIRSLCHDIGNKLGCGGVMSALQRTRVGDFDIKDAYTISEVKDKVDAGTFDEILLSV